MPIPMHAFCMTSSSSSDSVIMPATFLSRMVMSFGHRSSGDIPHASCMASATATPAPSGSRDAADASHAGYSTTDIQMPPRGETHLLSALPLAPVCVAAMTAAPSFAGLCSRPAATSCVEPTVSQYMILLPTVLVSRPSATSHGYGSSHPVRSLYPTFCLDSMPYPSPLRALMCFHTATLLIPRTSPRSRPERYSELWDFRNPSVLARPAGSLMSCSMRRFCARLGPAPLRAVAPLLLPLPVLASLWLSVVPSSWGLEPDVKVKPAAVVHAAAAAVTTTVVHAAAVTPFCSRGHALCGDV